MSKSSSATRPKPEDKKQLKPSIAYSSEELALKNIKNKLEALRCLLEACKKDAAVARLIWNEINKNAERILVPFSQRQFLIWTNEGALKIIGVEAVTFSKIGNGTLGRYPELHKEVGTITKDLFGRLKSANEITELTENQTKRALKKERNRTKILEAELVRLRRELRDAKIDVEARESEIRDLCRQHGLFRKPAIVKN
ncbi:hypothetical protein [Paraburkholderia sp. BL9I2N2]|uniref:hypothetical protein n=1 Tax=Paraburkholderia sp. BL9I2N2 TaxID=1938809 RepID=UPI001044A7C0|nr:hypothetical protein [Paraburkholderia sp. BL9I2N2]TCK96992.1 hypothetical protein B0G74_3693 [Paraburkholderia sp. BL9I2N2]